MKKFLIFLFVTTLVVCMPVMAFADDETAETGPEEAVVLETEPEESFSQEASSEEAEEIAEPEAKGEEEQESLSPQEPEANEAEAIPEEPVAEAVEPIQEEPSAPEETEPQKLEDKYPGLSKRLQKGGEVDLRDLGIPASAEGELSAIAAQYGDEFYIVMDGGKIEYVIYEDDGEIKATVKQHRSNVPAAAAVTEEPVMESEVAETAEVIEAEEAPLSYNAEEGAVAEPIGSFGVTLLAGLAGLARLLRAMFM